MMPKPKKRTPTIKELQEQSGNERYDLKDLVDIYPTVKIDEPPELISDLEFDELEKTIDPSELTLLDEYMHYQCKMDVELYKHRKRWQKIHVFSSYAQSTPNRAHFCRQMLLGGKDGQTASELAEKLELDISTISVLLKECQQFVPYALIKRNEKTGFERYFLPTKQLINAMRSYANYVANQSVIVKEFRSQLLFFEFVAAKIDRFAKD